MRPCDVIVAGAHFPHPQKEKVFILSFKELTEFNETFGVVIRTEPNVRVPEARLRYRLIKEEFGELIDAVEDCDIVEVLDALGDIVYVVEGAALAFGMAEIVEEMFTDSLAGEGFERYGENNPLLTREGQELMLKDFRNAVLSNDTQGVAVALSAFLFLVYDLDTYYNVPVDQAVSAIHLSNMTKLDADGNVLRRESDNKIMKSDLYKTPTADLEKMLFEDDGSDGVDLQ